MYAWWYVVIGLAALIVIGAVIWIVGYYKDFNTEWVYRYGFDWEIFGTIGMTVCLVAVVLEFIVFPVTLIVSLGTKKEVAAFKYQKEYIATVVANADSLENVALTQTLIEQNQWLADAKASVELYGEWSAYYYAGVMELEPIVIER